MPERSGDAGAEYTELFRDKHGRAASWLPDGWDVGESEVVDTALEYLRDAWRIRSSLGDVAAVEHETGLEILVAVGVGISVNAITAVVASAWKEWRRRRDETSESRPTISERPAEDRLVFERIIESPDGTRTHRRTSVPAHLVTEERIQHLVESSLQAT